MKQEPTTHEEAHLALECLEQKFSHHTGFYGAVATDEFVESANGAIKLINQMTLPNYILDLGFLVSKNVKPYYEMKKITDDYDNIFDYTFGSLGSIILQNRLKGSSNRRRDLLGIEARRVKDGQAILYEYSGLPKKALLVPVERQVRILLDFHFLGYPKEDERK